MSVIFNASRMWKWLECARSSTLLPSGQSSCTACSSSGTNKRKTNQTKRVLFKRRIAMKIIAKFLFSFKRRAVRDQWWPNFSYMELHDDIFQQGKQSVMSARRFLLRWCVKCEKRIHTLCWRCSWKSQLMAFSIHSTIHFSLWQHQQSKWWMTNCVYNILEYNKAMVVFHFNWWWCTGSGYICFRERWMRSIYDFWVIFTCCIIYGWILPLCVLVKTRKH